MVLILNGSSYRDPLALWDHKTVVKTVVKQCFPGPFQEQCSPWGISAAKSLIMQNSKTSKTPFSTVFLCTWSIGTFQKKPGGHS